MHLGMEYHVCSSHQREIFVGMMHVDPSVLQVETVSLFEEVGGWKFDPHW